MNTTITEGGAPHVPVMTALRRRWSDGIRCKSDALFALGVSFVWLTLYNTRFWHDVFDAMWHGTLGSALFLVSLGVLVWCVQALLLLLLPSRRLMTSMAGLLFLIAAASSYFSVAYGVVMNAEMLRNVFQTDVAEARGLLSVDFVARILILGAVPAAVASRVRLPAMRWSKRVRKHAIAIGSILAVCIVALLSSSASYAVFFREHKPIRFMLMPAAPVTSALGLAFQTHAVGRAIGHAAGDEALVNASGSSHRISPASSTMHVKPLLVVMVVGETARAANFELGGYQRHTNEELGGLDGLVYFSHAMSCGTATATSVPCMFSHLPRKQFNVDAASGFANALDALQAAGLKVEWWDNNAGCKGVCARVATTHYSHSMRDPLCRESYCYDEIMLKDFATTLDTITQDTVIVMHLIGSHGPAYTERYPPEQERFKPACRTNELQRCTLDEVMNAYDNTIAYTDHVLARAIQMLGNASARVDGVLMYASDHGESLGEQGLYLHGLPYAFAPDSQKHVPMLMWLAPTYAAREEVSVDCLQSHAGEPRSHDNVYHTMLGAAGVRNDSYDAKLDVLAACRPSIGPVGHPRLKGAPRR